MQTKEELIHKLKEHGLKVTKPRTAILDILQESAGPISVEDIFKKISLNSKTNCDLASIYRSLSSFEEIGIVQKIDLFDGAAHYELKKGQHHRHFFICKNCQKMEKLDACLVGPLEKTLKAKGYTELSHRLELSGICPNCSK